MSRRVVIASDLLGGNPDMGERVYARGIARALAERNVAVVSLAGQSEIADQCLDAGRLLAAGNVRGVLRRFRPEVVLYLQRSSLTFGGVCRAWRLQRLAGCPVVPVVAMPHELQGAWKSAAGRLRPAAVAALSQEVIERAREVWPGILTRIVPGGVDERFSPVSRDRRLELRAGHGWTADEAVLLHVGHLSQSRNLGALRALTSLRGVRVVIVMSSTTPPDVALRKSLLDAGVTLIEGYDPNIEDIFRAADVYVFPTMDSGGCIGLPISVLEALACGLPVATTRFGELPALLQSNPGVRWIDANRSLADVVSELIASGVSEQPFFSAGWAEAAEALLSLSEEVR